MRIPGGHCIGRATFLLLLCFIAGCAESHEQRASRLEPFLSQAGFRAVPANTPARAEKLHQLTALKVSYLTHNGKLVYWFPDPYVCHCLYRGNEQNYEKYHELRVEASKAEDFDAGEANQADAQTYMDFMGSPAAQVFYGESP
jgi:hypothetical protein